MKEIELLEGLVYVEPGGKPLLADLYLPKASGSSVPVILWLHGGGWRIGDRKLGPDLSRYFAQCGYAMASIDYRLSGEAKFPAQIEDVLAAIRWLGEIGSQYGINSERIGLWGSSAGGHLAALAGTKMPDQIRAVVDGYGPIDFLQMDEQRNLMMEQSGEDAETSRLKLSKHSADADSPESQLLGAPINEVPEKVREANPVTYVRNGLPPYLIMHGLSDVPVPSHQSELLYEALVASDNDATLCLVPGLGHAFFNQDDLGYVPMEVRSSDQALSKWMPMEQTLSFDLIESFFRHYLMK